MHSEKLPEIVAVDPGVAEDPGERPAPAFTMKRDYERSRALVVFEAHMAIALANCDPSDFSKSVVGCWPDRTGAYGSQTPEQTLGSDNQDHSATALLSGLMSATTYHCRLVVTNRAGTTYGTDQTFATPLTHRRRQNPCLIATAELESLDVAGPIQACHGVEGALTDAWIGSGA